MSKVYESTSDIFVRKCLESNLQLLKKSDIEKFWLRSGWSKSRLSYAVSLLLSRSFKRIARDIYMSDTQNEENLYWGIISSLIEIHAPSWAIISGEKSLEISLRNYSSPDILILYTRDTNLRIRLVSGREVHFRTCMSGEKTGHKNMFPFFIKNSRKEQLLQNILYLCPEIALLDSLTLRRHGEWVADITVLKFLKVYEKSFSGEILRDAVKRRYIRSMNRLRAIAVEHGYNSLYQLSLDIIKREWGSCFVSVK